MGSFSSLKYCYSTSISTNLSIAMQPVSIDFPDNGMGNNIEIIDIEDNFKIIEIIKQSYSSHAFTQHNFAQSTTDLQY